MTERRRQFFERLAALMEEYGVSMEVREDWAGYDGCRADGIDFDFVYLPWTEQEEATGVRDTERQGATVECTDLYFPADVVRRLATDDSEK